MQGSGEMKSDCLMNIGTYRHGEVSWIGLSMAIQLCEYTKAIDHAL